MIICIISREFPPGNLVGGIGTYSLTAGRLLSRRGHRVHILTCGPALAVTEEEGMTVHRVPLLPHHFKPGSLFYLYRKWYRKLLPVYLNALTWSRTAAAYFERLSREESVDVVEYPETMGEGARLVLPAGTSAVCRIHSSSLSHVVTNGLEKYLIINLQQKACSNAHRVVSPSKYVIQHYARKILKCPAPVQLSRNPVIGWSQKIRWTHKSPRHLLYVGRIEHRKGVHTLIDAFRSLLEEYPDLHLKIVGACHPPLIPEDHTAQKEFREFVAEFRDGGVEYCRDQPHDSLWRYYDWAGILVLPSLMENYPYVAVEGLSRGCYVVASDTGGVGEIVWSDAQGLLFKPDDSSDLKEKLVCCLTHTKSWKKRAVKLSEEFDGRLSQKRWLEKFEQDAIPV